MSGSGKSINRYRAHQILVKEFKLKAQKRFGNKIRFKDRHVGKFLPLVFIKKLMRGEVELKDWGKYVVAINSKGMADLYGFISLHNILIHLEAEVKTGKAVQTKEQKDWQKLIESMGGCYLLVRDSEEAIQQLENYLRERKLI